MVEMMSRKVMRAEAYRNRNTNTGRGLLYVSTAPVSVQYRNNVKLCNLPW
jgi:hypothetical protein